MAAVPGRTSLAMDPAADTAADPIDAAALPAGQREAGEGDRAREREVEEYVALWRRVLNSVDQRLPDVLDLGILPNKIEADVIDAAMAKCRRVLDLRTELKELDQQYATKLAQLSAEQEAGRGPATPDTRDVRITDFLQGLAAVFQQDFSRAQDLQYFLQQIYLFQTQK